MFFGFHVFHARQSPCCHVSSDARRAYSICFVSRPIACACVLKRDIHCPRLRCEPGVKMAECCKLGAISAYWMYVQYSALSARGHTTGRLDQVQVGVLRQRAACRGPRPGHGPAVRRLCRDDRGQCAVRAHPRDSTATAQRRRISEVLVSDRRTPGSRPYFGTWSRYLAATSGSQAPSFCENSRSGRWSHCIANVAGPVR
jgi:hypothetical protein